MSGTIQGSANSIGMAPQGAGGRSSVLAPLGDAAPATGGATDVSGGATAATDPAAAGATAAPAVPTSMLPTAMTAGGLFGMAGGAAGFAIGSKRLAEAGTSKAVQALTAQVARNGGVHLVGDLATTAGVKALGKGPTWMKWGGAAAAIAGLGAFTLGRSASASQKTEQAKVETIAAYNAQLEPALQGIQEQHQAELDAMKAQVGGGAAADPAAAGTPAAGSDAEAAAATMTGGEAAPMIQLPNTPAATGATGATGASGASGASATTAAGGVGGATSALVGSTIDLAAGTGSSGAQVAEAGTYAIAQDMGSFATLDEANAAVRATMDPEAMGTRYMRYAVVQSGNSFHAVVATALEGGQPKPLTAAQGQVVAWNALGHVSDAAGNAGWQAYSWSAQGGATSIAVPYGDKPFPSGTGATTPGATTTPGTATTTTPGAATPVAGGGAVAPASQAGTAFDPGSVLGRTFSSNASTTAEGAVVSGGAIQLQGFVAASTGGFGTADQAAVAARQARASLPASNPFARVVTMQGSDGRYYVFQASVVARETAPLQNAAPMHVFGAGFASYYDGSTAAWQSLADR